MSERILTFLDNYRQIEISKQFAESQRGLYRCKTQDLIEYQQNHSLDLGFVPSMIRYIDPSKNVVVLERPPHKRNITFHAMNDDDEETYENYRLPIPWQVYVVHSCKSYLSVSLLFNHQELKSLDDALYIPPLPNVYPDIGKICLSVYDGTVIEKTGSFSLEDLINSFWASIFNDEVMPDLECYNIAAKDHHSSLKTFLSLWSELSLEEVCDESHFQVDDGIFRLISSVINLSGSNRYKKDIFNLAIRVSANSANSITVVNDSDDSGTSIEVANDAE